MGDWFQVDDEWIVGFIVIFGVIAWGALIIFSVWNLLFELRDEKEVDNDEQNQNKNS